MALNPQQIDQLLRMIQRTRENELTCPECVDELDKFTQCTLDGKPIQGLLERVREHLEDCPFCAREFQLVLETLKAIED
jgi:hypothetical protein